VDWARDLILNRSSALFFIAIAFTPASYCDNADAQLEAHRLERSELQSWIAKEFKTGESVTFASNEGEGLCCDVGSVTLEINRDRSITITANYIAGIGCSLPYAIEADGWKDLTRDVQGISGTGVAGYPCSRPVCLSLRIELLRGSR
jgi:hypothetical protein